MDVALKVGNSNVYKFAIANGRALLSKQVSAAPVSWVLVETMKNEMLQHCSILMPHWKKKGTGWETSSLRSTTILEWGAQLASVAFVEGFHKALVYGCCFCSPVITKLSNKIIADIPFPSQCRGQQQAESRLSLLSFNLPGFLVRLQLAPVPGCWWNGVKGCVIRTGRGP